MTKEDIYLRLTAVFRDVFDDETITVNETTTADDIDDWDSLTHITLLASIEADFGIHFDMKTILKMKNVGEMADTIAALMQ